MSQCWDHIAGNRSEQVTVDVEIEITIALQLTADLTVRYIDRECVRRRPKSSWFAICHFVLKFFPAVAEVGFISAGGTHRSHLSYASPLGCGALPCLV